MSKSIFVSILISFVCIISLSAQSFYDLTAKDINGNTFDFSTLKGKKVLIVNVASKCGFTPQYADLQKLYETYGGEKFEIIGFPANNFMKQEPGTDAMIKSFCTKNYGVTFPIMSKISVKGEDIHPVYQWLTQRSKNGVKSSEVKWNFQKYLIDENGKLVKVFAPKVNPTDEKITKYLAK